MTAPMFRTEAYNRGASFGFSIGATLILVITLLSMGVAAVLDTHFYKASLLGVCIGAACAIAMADFHRREANRADD